MPILSTSSFKTVKSFLAAESSLSKPVTCSWLHNLTILILLWLYLILILLWLQQLFFIKASDYFFSTAQNQ